MPKSQTQTQQPGHDEIAGRAYQRYLERGALDGYDLEDWLAAEEQLVRERLEPQTARRQKLSKSEAA